MYKYFKELERPNEFKIHMIRCDRSSTSLRLNSKIDIDFINKYKNLFERLKVINKIIDSSVSLENIDDIGGNVTSIIEKKGEGDLISDNEVIFRSQEFSWWLYDYLEYCNYIINIYPNLKEFIQDTISMIKKARDEIEMKNKIEFPKLSKGVLDIYPNAWYITPTGYLYNTGLGHQEGSLSYPYYHVLKALEKGGNIINKNYLCEIEKIIKRGYVDASQYKNYANRMLKFPKVYIDEIIGIEKYKEVYDSIYFDKRRKELEVQANKQINRWYFNKIKKENNPAYFEKIVKIEATDETVDDEIINSVIAKGFEPFFRSYQKNIKTLIIGYLAALSCLYKTFSTLNDSTRKKELAEELYKLEKDELFVRFLGFHKVSSVLDKTITTSSIESIEHFKEYLDNGWTLDIVPKIIYDERTDRLVEADHNSYYIRKYLDKVLDDSVKENKVLIFENKTML